MARKYERIKPRREFKRMWNEAIKEKNNRIHATETMYIYMKDGTCVLGDHYDIHTPLMAYIFDGECWTAEINISKVKEIRG